MNIRKKISVIADIDLDYTHLKELIKSSESEDLKCVSKEFILNTGLEFVFSDILDLIKDRESDYYCLNSSLTFEQKEKLRRILHARDN